MCVSVCCFICLPPPLYLCETIFPPQERKLEKKMQNVQRGQDPFNRKERTVNQLIQLPRCLITLLHS